MEDESEEEEELVEQIEEKQKDHFVSNPEEMRALAEQRRLSKRGNRPGPQPSHRSNVVGESSLVCSCIILYLSINMCTLHRGTPRTRSREGGYYCPEAKIRKQNKRSKS